MQLSFSSLYTCKFDEHVRVVHAHATISQRLGAANRGSWTPEDYGETWVEYRIERASRISGVDTKNENEKCSIYAAATAYENYVVHFVHYRPRRDRDFCSKSCNTYFARSLPRSRSRLIFELFPLSISTNSLLLRYRAPAFNCVQIHENYLLRCETMYST